MRQLFRNNAFARLQHPAQPGTKELYLAVGYYSVFPDIALDSGDYFFVTLLNPVQSEVLKVIGNRDGELTLETSITSTHAYFPENAFVELRVCAEMFDDIRERSSAALDSATEKTSGFDPLAIVTKSNLAEEVSKASSDLKLEGETVIVAYKPLSSDRKVFKTGSSVRVRPPWGTGDSENSAPLISNDEGNAKIDRVKSWNAVVLGTLSTSRTIGGQTISVLSNIAMESTGDKDPSEEATIAFSSNIPKLALYTLELRAG